MDASFVTSVFLLSAALIACCVWFEAWSRIDRARLAAALKLAWPTPLPTRPNQYSSDIPRTEPLPNPAAVSDDHESR
jgi:hypothetical protein